MQRARRARRERREQYLCRFGKRCIYRHKCKFEHVVDDMRFFLKQETSLSMSLTEENSKLCRDNRAMEKVIQEKDAEVSLLMKKYEDLQKTLQFQSQPQPQEQSHLHVKNLNERECKVKDSKDVSTSRRQPRFLYVPNKGNAYVSLCVACNFNPKDSYGGTMCKACYLKRYGPYT